MQIAPSTAIIEVMPIVPVVRVPREPESPRERSKNWAAPSTIGRGQLIDLVV
ncbi:MAG TPA: hypothetical protein VHX19_01035 [Stellaceae bacterium]|jgi:hypothetical protein|nr:hypothetical protein [Stellaceae bacterium]